MEICSTIFEYNYLFKYPFKGPDQAGVAIPANPNERDEITEYRDACYVSPPEAMGCVFGFDTMTISPSVECLAVHLPGDNLVVAQEFQSIVDVTELHKRSTLEAWFQLNERDPAAHNLHYAEVPEHYRWDEKHYEWTPHQHRQERPTIGRIYFANPRDQELYSLRMLLLEVKGAKGFEALRTVNGIVHSTFRAACVACGLMRNDEESANCLREAKFCVTSGKMFTALFATCLVYQDPAKPHALWEEFKDTIVMDMVIRKQLQGDIGMEVQPDEEMYQQGLLQLERYLRGMGSSITKFPSLPQLAAQVASNLPKAQHRVHTKQQEIDAWDANTLEVFMQDGQQKLNVEQLQAFNKIKEAVCDDMGNRPYSRLYFVDGAGGCGKTFLYNLLLAWARSTGKIAIAVATSGVAATLLMGGTTAHSRFRLPVFELTRDTISSMPIESDAALLLAQSSLIIWDEAPMAHRFLFETVDRLLRDIMKCEEGGDRLQDVAFGGKVVVFGGDFKQCLPVVKRGTRSEIVGACLTSSPLWQKVCVLHLTVNMRVEKMLTNGSTPQEVAAAKDFSQQLLQVGRGQLKDFDCPIQGQHNHIVLNSEKYHILPPHHLPKERIQQLFNAVYPDLLQNFKRDGYLTERAILAPINTDVDAINRHALEVFPGQEYVALSVDTLSLDEQQNNIPLEYVHSQNPASLPPHVLRLKVGIEITADIAVSLTNSPYNVGGHATFGHKELPSRQALQWHMSYPHKGQKAPP